MTGKAAAVWWLLPVILVFTAAVRLPDPAPTEYILLNGVQDTKEAFQQIAVRFGDQTDGRIKIGVGCIISYLALPPDRAAERLRSYLRLSAQFSLPIVVQLDGEQWWQGRPDLWNWWDKTKPGYDPANKWNVEWTDWSPDSAVKIGWRNWGRQIRVLPMVNLMSPVYRKACHQAMQRLIPIIMDWWRGLPPEKQYLLAGIKLGWESAIGVNNFYYPGGNDLLRRPASEDPAYGLTVDSLPGRGVEAIGYAAVSTLGLASSGKLTPDQLTEVVHRHLEDLCRYGASLGVPRDRLFTHCGGWSPGESLYTAAVNPYSCPGWSFYDHSDDPLKDTTAMEALKTSNAPYWGAVEWLYAGKTMDGWAAALKKTLAAPRIRYLCIYNWSGIRDNPAAIAAIQSVAAGR